MKERANRIHITSSGPRTGTTLLAEVMKTCFDIDCACDHEAPLCLSNSSFGDCRTILTKMPSSTYNLEKVINWDPNLYVICIIRDPRDMVCSYHGKVREKYYCDLKFWFEFIDNYRNLKGNERVLLIKYEDFTENPNSIQKLIMAKMPFLKKKHDFSDFHLYAKPVNDSIQALKNLRPIESKGIGNWKNHLPRIKQQLQEFNPIDDSLICFGFEKDNNWIKSLSEVKTEHYESFRKNKSRYWRNKRSLLLAYLNISLEKKGINPDRFLAPFKRILQIRPH